MLRCSSILHIYGDRVHGCCEGMCTRMYSCASMPKPGREFQSFRTAHVFSLDLREQPKDAAHV